MLDELNPDKVIEKCESLGIKLPKMLQILSDSQYKTFYSSNHEFLNLNGEYEKIN